MSLEQIFYIIGIVYMTSWLLFLLVTVIFISVIVIRLKRLKKRMETKGKLLFYTAQAVQSLPWKKIVSVVSWLSLFRKITTLLTNEDKDSQHG
jgi:hypothetical protein